MRLRWLIAALPGVLLLSCSGKSNSPAPDVTTPVVTTPVATVPDKVYTFESTPYWADEFDAKIATTKWGYDIGAGGWGNHELEYYTNGNNSAIVNGNLVITANKANVQGANYTSARMFSKGNAGSFLYGRIEIRAKIPPGKGTWPAIWMLPTDYAYGGWPNSGEIDIMEHVGYDPNNMYVTVHTGAYNHTINTQKGVTIPMPTATSDQHTYRLDWTPSSITEYIDGVQQFFFKNEGTGSPAWPFDKRFHMMLNVAVGGDWGGAQGVDDSSFPAAMQVDYIRYYRINNL